MDAFFAAVELLRHPDIRGRPLIVGGTGDPTRRGVVSTASYEARRFGVRSGMPLRTAYRLCPEAIFLPVDYPAYSAISEQIKAILREFSPLLEEAGIDEAFLDLSHAPDSAVQVARAIKGRIKEQTGLTCSAGIAPNKLLAKIASDMDKPDGLTPITEQDIATRIWPLPVRKLWGVGPKTEARLAGLGVATIGELAQLADSHLVAHFGQAHGLYLCRAAHGIDDTPLITHWEPKSLSRETTFQRDVGHWPTLAATLRRLTKELVARLEEAGYLAHNVTVKLRFSDFDTHTHAITLPAPTRELESIQEAAVGCLNRFALVKRVRLIGVRVGGLLMKREEPGDAQPATETRGKPRCA